MRWSTVAVILLAFVVRVGVQFAVLDSLETDPDGYRGIAENLVRTGTLGHDTRPSAFRAPLYPLLISPCVALGEWATTAIAAVHVVIGVLTVWAVMRLALMWGLGNWSLVAGLLVAVDPLLVHQSTQVMTETLAALLAVFSLWSATVAQQRPTGASAFAAGIWACLAALCRPTFIPWVVIVGWRLGREASDTRRRQSILGALALAIAVTLGVWIARNQWRLGSPIVGTTHGGYTLLLGNNPEFYAFLRGGGWRTTWDSADFNRRFIDEHAIDSPADEIRVDREAYREAWQHIRDDPAAFALSSIWRVGSMWDPLPHALSPREPLHTRLLRYTIGGWNAVVLILAVIGLLSSHDPHDAPHWRIGILMVLCVTAVHLLFWSTIRMRAPLVPVVAIFAAGGLRACGRWLLEHKS